MPGSSCSWCGCHRSSLTACVTARLERACGTSRITESSACSSPSPDTTGPASLWSSATSRCFPSWENLKRSPKGKWCAPESFQFFSVDENSFLACHKLVSLTFTLIAFTFLIQLAFCLTMENFEKQSRQARAASLVSLCLPKLTRLFFSRLTLKVSHRRIYLFICRFPQAARST